MAEQEQTDPNFFDLSDEEKARLPYEQLICLVLLRHDELHEESHSNSDLTSIFAAEIGIDMEGDGDEKAKEARESLIKAIRDARTHKLVDFEMVDGGIRPSVTDVGRTTVEASIKNLREHANGHTP